MVIEIPTQLKKPQFKFCLLEGDTKKPFEPLWNTKNNYPYVDPKLLNHIEQGNNYGAMGGYGRLGILDLDEMSILSDVERILPKTLTVETGSGKRHYYFLVPTGTPKIIFTKNKIHYGELQSTGSQCVGPGSIHPVTKKPYKVINDIEIAELPQETVNKLKELYSDEVNDEPIKVVKWDMYNKSQIDFSISSLTPKLGNLKTKGNEMFGSHPIHGSQTGMNFHVNTSKNLWHCFRCNSGGDALALLSVLEGVCDCKDFSAGGKKLRGEDFKKVLDIAKNSYGLNINNRSLVELELQHSRIYNKKEIRIITDFELENLETKEIGWVIEHLIAEHSINLIAGKTGTMKSFLTNLMALCSSHNLSFLNKFKTKKLRWLYFDEENSEFLDKNRNKILRKGLNIDSTKDVGYVIYSGIKIDRADGLGKLVELISSFKPNVVVLDSFVRFLSVGTDENSSIDMSSIINSLKTIAQENNVAFILLHHMSKGKGKSEDIDAVRGSSDIVNAPDLALIFSQSGKNIYVQQKKNRYELKHDPFTIIPVPEFDENKVAISLKFEVVSSEVEKMDIESTAAVRIYAHFKKMISEGGEKVFRTGEVIEKFKRRFSHSSETERQVINNALKMLIREGKVSKVKKGYYKLLDLDEERISTLSDFDDTEEPETETEDLTS